MTDNTASSENSLKEQIDIGEFMRVDLRVGKVLEAQAVPDSKKLLKLQVDLGSELGQRQILAGIAREFAAESLVGKQIVVVANLKPARLAGLESQGMLLAVGENEPLSLLQPGSEVPLGSCIR